MRKIAIYRYVRLDSTWLESVRVVVSDATYDGRRDQAETSVTGEAGAGLRSRVAQDIRRSRNRAVRSG